MDAPGSSPPPPRSAAAPPSVVVGTAGHIDHGKSALVEALTGTHPDRLEAERRRGMTIELGFAHATLPAADSGRPIQIGFVDVPGHERFVRNMLAGAGGIDLVLLVVAADDGVQPQTREHFDICRLLGIAGGVVALTKCDLASAERQAEVRAQIAALAAGSFLESAPVVAVALRSGPPTGLAVLRAALAAACSASAAPRHVDAPFRFPIDRVFTLPGFGTVVTGTVVQGGLEAPPAARSGARVELALPGVPERRIRLRGLQVYGRPAARACAGQRAALNLAAIDPAELSRGMMLADPGVFRPAPRLDVELTLLPGAPAPRQRARVHIYWFAAETVAQLLWLEAPPAAPHPGARGWAQLRLETPLPAVPGDRFILRQLSPLLTLGGGRVLDADPPRRRAPQFAAAAAGLRCLADSDDGRDVPAARRFHLRRAGPAGLGLGAFAAALGEPAARLRAALLADAAVAADPDAATFFLAEFQNQAETAILAAAAAFQSANPLLGGPDAEQLGAATGTPPVLLAAALRCLAGAGRLESDQNRWRVPGPPRPLAPDLAAPRAALERRFREAGLAPPDLAEACPDAPSRQLLHSLVRDGLLVRLADGLYCHAAALDALRRLLAAKRPGHPRFSVPDFKQWTGVSRKFAIPLLEYCDQRRLTRRLGDLREILPNC